MSDALILVAGGSGTRMGASIPKQFLLLAAKPVLQHTLEKFHQAIPDLEIILVLPESQFDYWEDLILKYSLKVPHKVVAGGESRSHSVYNGLQSCNADGIIAIHDAVRPLLSIEMIRNCYSQAREFGNAIPAIPLKDSLRFIESEINSQVPRDAYRAIQTPQCFAADLIKDAYNKWDGKAMTDDASVAELQGVKVHLCNGESRNIKITDQQDLLIAEALISDSTNNQG